MRATFLLIFFITLNLMLFAQEHKNIKVLEVQGAKKIQLDHPTSNLEIKFWDENFIRMEVTIHSNVPKKVLEELLKKGRYQILGKKLRDDYLVLMPNFHIPLTIEGQELKEVVSVKYYAPSYYTLGEYNIIRKDLTDETVALLRPRCNCTEEEIKEHQQALFAIQEVCEVTIEFTTSCKSKKANLSKYKFKMDDKIVKVEKMKFPKIPKS